jgi:hypothetical protein
MSECESGSARRFTSTRRRNGQPEHAEQSPSVSSTVWRSKFERLIVGGRLPLMRLGYLAAEANVLLTLSSSTEASFRAARKRCHDTTIGTSEYGRLS